MAESQVPLSGTSATGLQWYNYPGYENISGHYGLGAAVLVPPNRRIVATSGHTGRTGLTERPESLEEEFVIAFTHIEQSISAVDPSLSAHEIWNSIYQITSYHAEGFDKEVAGVLLKVARQFGLLGGDHRPAWTAVEVKSLNMGVRMEIGVFAALP